MSLEKDDTGNYRINGKWGAYLQFSAIILRTIGLPLLFIGAGWIVRAEIFMGQGARVTPAIMENYVNLRMEQHGTKPAHPGANTDLQLIRQRLESQGEQIRRNADLLSANSEAIADLRTEVRVGLSSIERIIRDE